MPSKSDVLACCLPVFLTSVVAVWPSAGRGREQQQEARREGQQENGGETAQGRGSAQASRAPGVAGGAGTGTRGVRRMAALTGGVAVPSGGHRLVRESGSRTGGPPQVMGATKSLRHVVWNTHENQGRLHTKFRGFRTIFRGGRERPPRRARSGGTQWLTRTSATATSRRCASASPASPRRACASTKASTSTRCCKGCWTRRAR